MAAIARKEAAEIFGLPADPEKEKPEMEPRRRDTTQALEETSGATGQSGASRRQRATGRTTARETTVANGATKRTHGRTSPRR